MDGRRFDRFARSLAAWTSRRRVLTGAAAGAAGGLLGVRRGRAQGEGGPDAEVLQAIADISTELLPRLDPRNYESEPRPADNYLGQQYDPVRLPEFVLRLQNLVTAGTQAASWDSAQLQNFLDTIALIPLAASAGADADVYLHQYAISELGPGADPPATPTVPAECISPHRPGTCTATCLQVWADEALPALAANDAKKIVEEFRNFLDCFLLWGSASTECLAPLIDDGCIPQVTCGCRGNCL